MVYAFNFLPSLIHLWEGVKHRSFFGGYKSFSTKGRAFKLIREDTPFGYDDTNFQSSTLNHGEVMGSEVHPGNKHILKKIHKLPQAMIQTFASRLFTIF